jgi:hypothetical protein
MVYKMEIHELADLMEKHFDKQDKVLEKLDEKVTSHDRWLWFIKGAGMLLAAIVGWTGIKVHLP